jgi:membrane-associated phospholipid phosphatase
MNKLTKKISLSLLVATAAVANGDDWDADHLIERSGDILQIALPLTALTATYTLDDASGRKQLLASYSSTILTTHVLKRVVRKKRPDGSNRLSFPSGHTSSAFSGAAFLAKRYGWEVGIPAYLAASFTGYSRVHADRHDWWDVAAGAALAIGFNEVFVNKPDGLNVVFQPMNQGGALMLSYNY